VVGHRDGDPLLAVAVVTPVPRILTHRLGDAGTRMNARHRSSA